MLAWQLATDIADRIRELRELLGWTQERFAHEAGRRWQAVSEWERGVRKPAHSVLDRLAGKQGWPLTMFIEGGPRPREVLASITRQIAPLSLLTGSGEAEGGADSEPVEGPGWMFQDPAEAEEQFRTYIRALDRTHRMMVGDPAAIDTDVLRELQLTAVELAEKQCQLAGRAIPEFLRRVRNELIARTFH